MIQSNKQNKFQNYPFLILNKTSFVYLCLFILCVLYI